MKSRILCWILIGTSWLDAQVVLSQRAYVEHGRTFSQIWLADAGNLNFRQLTHSRRDHSEPVCSRDGKVIYFVSDRDAERSRNSYGGYHSNDREVWAYDRQTGEERFIWRTSRDFGLDLTGTAANGAVLVSVGAELRSLTQNPRVIDNWVIDNVDEAAVIPQPAGRELRGANTTRLSGPRTARGSPPFSTGVSPSSAPRLARKSSASRYRSATRRLMTSFGRPMGRACWPVSMVRMGAPGIRKTITSF
jgi:dipeptidyl aminopeptidase/acylaminoacyl peptidase